MRIVFMGSPEFAVPALEALHNSHHEIVAVVSGADKRRGRGNELMPTPVKAKAMELGLPVIEWEMVKHRASDIGHRALDIGHVTLDIGHCGSCAECQVSKVDCRMPSTEYRVSSIECRVSSVESCASIVTKERGSL